MRFSGWLFLIVLLYALHQDFWFWRAARPLAFGFLPVGLSYHAIYCVVAAALMWCLTRYTWPADLEKPSGPPDRLPGASEQDARR
jgi:hypothetical protein